MDLACHLIDNSLLSHDIEHNLFPITFAHMARGPLLLTVCPISLRLVGGKRERSLPRALALPVLSYF